MSDPADIQSISILGSTGSIGKSTLDVVRRHPDLYRVFAISAHTNSDLLYQQCLEFKPQYAVMVDEQKAQRLVQLLNDTPTDKRVNTQVLSGTTALCDIAKDPQVDAVMAAIVGAAGLLPTLAGIEAGKKVLLANKESLVMTGELFIEKVKQNNATLLPIDSEHNAIFQCLPPDMQHNPLAYDLHQQGISKILLTGSGGPFLTKPITEFDTITPEQAVAHPNWSMGQKISVDSATMMNKGLEFIEACVMFNLRPDEIEVVLHPQSIIHSMVQYVDGSVLAQMGNPDMRTPIAHALAFPKRIASGVKPLDFFSCGEFSFERPEPARYPNLYLAIQACRAGQDATTMLNAANEVAVAAFLNKSIGFADIHRVNSYVMTQDFNLKATSVEQVLEIDRLSRIAACELVEQIAQNSLRGRR